VARHRASLAHRRESARRKRLNANPLYNPGQQLAGYRLHDAASQLADAEIRPQLGALDRQSKTISTQGGALLGRAGDYYRQLAGQVAGDVARSRALQDRSRSEIAGINNQTQTQLQGLQTQENQRVSQDAALRGPGISQSAAGDLASQRARALLQAQTQQSGSEATGANYGGLLSSTAAATGMRGGEVQGQLSNRILGSLSDIAGKRSDLAAQRGPLGVKYLTDLRQKGFENMATTQGLGLKAADLKAQTEDQRGRRKIAWANLSETERRNRAQEKIARINAEIRQGGLTETRRNHLVTEKQNWQKILHPRKATGPGGGGGGGGGGSGSETRHAPGYGHTNVSLAKGGTSRQQWLNILNSPTKPKGNAYLIAAAKEYAKGGNKVSKQTALKIWRNFGFRVPYGKASPVVH
jgi:hypothetical protein